MLATLYARSAKDLHIETLELQLQEFLPPTCSSRCKWARINLIRHYPTYSIFAAHLTEHKELQKSQKLFLMFTQTYKMSKMCLLIPHRSTTLFSSSSSTHPVLFSLPPF